jgi:nucleotide-binding universal stress UspA family protein
MQQARQPVVAVRPDGPELEFRRLLCPVDSSPVARHGLRNAIRLARAFKGELVVLSIIPELSWLGAAVETGVFAGAQEQHAADWEDEFTRFLEPIDFSGVNWRRDLRFGSPHRAIVQATREHRADLIVMGATGRTGLVRMMMGSTTRRVLQDLPCSILTVHDQDLPSEEPEEEDLRIGRLLYAEAKALLEAGTYEAALVKLDQVLTHNPFHLPALAARAEACEKLGQHERSERCRRRIEVLRHDLLV